MPLQRTASRPGFTVIELMVVILILVVLASLVLSTLGKVNVFVDEVRTTSEIQQLAQACEQFKLRFGRYPPSRIMLVENPNNAPVNNPLYQYSRSYLTSLFSGMNPDLFADVNGGGINTPGLEWHDWNGNGTVDGPFVLEGHQCLVYFLGGPRLVGWSTNRQNPTLPVTPGATRDGPYYEFDAGRVPMNGQGMPQGFLDHYGTPYAYFLARDASTNNYFNDCPQLINQMANQAQGGVGNIPYQPYFQSISGAAPNFVIRYHRPDKFQIVSAGRDRVFGLGGHYLPSQPQNSPFASGPPLGLSPTDPRYDLNGDSIVDDWDNITNFTGGRLVAE